MSCKSLDKVLMQSVYWLAAEITTAFAVLATPSLARLSAANASA